MRDDATVLVLDDDPDFATTLRSVLEVKGYPAIVRHDGPAALEIIQRESVAVAVIDHKLDVMPGIEVLREIKQRYPSTECILLTGYASQELAIEAINLGGFGFLQKPCDLDQLLLMVRRAVEKRDALEALRESEAHTRAILHSSLDAVVTLDELGTVIDWNPQAEKMLGWSRREALGRPFFDLVFGAADEATRPAWAAPAEIALLGRPVAARLRHKDGREVLVEWAVTRVEAAGRRTLTFFIKNVTVRKQLERQFSRAHRMEAVNLLAGGVLHDFSNVLTAIMGHGALMRQDARLADEHRQTARDILAAARRASDLARQLLAYTRPQDRRPETLDLGAVIMGMGRLLKGVVGESVDLRKSLAPDLPPIELDRSELEQVILHLVLNAHDAMPDGGVLTLETAVVETDAGARVELAVRDFGTGMEHQVRQRAFEPFFTTGSGAGLGLPTVQTLVEENGGEIRLESAPGEGTTCRVRFPPRQTARTTRAAADAREDPGGSETLMLVEDEAMLRATLGRVLRRFGYRVLDADGGEEALRRAEDHAEGIDLLVTDVIMPRMSGKELARRLRERRPDIRVLFISGYADEAGFREDLIDDDAELLPKPFTPEALLRRIRRMLDTSATG